jgi:resolvase-like protein
MGALAEFERDLIRERTNAGLASARARDRVGEQCSVRYRSFAIFGKAVLLSSVQLCLSGYALGRKDLVPQLSGELMIIG